ncbi:MAG: hypothetical protein ACFHVJ_10320 [Aestuariibacter sp.]
MNVATSLPQDKKLHVLFRVEPGCMGPAGLDHIQEFIKFAQDEVERFHPEFVHWEIVARMNKKLPEMQYKVGNKNLTHDKAARYLDHFDQCLDDFEEELHDLIAELVDKFWDEDASRGT